MSLPPPYSRLSPVRIGFYAAVLVDAYLVMSSAAADARAL